MGALVVDTHAAIWYLLDSERLSARALRSLAETEAAGDPVYMASISLVEVIYLVEKGRLPPIALTRLNQALAAPDGGLEIVPLDERVARFVQQIPRDQVADMPDRIIAATALHLHIPLVTRDRKIRGAAIETLW